MLVMLVSFFLTYLSPILHFTMIDVQMLSKHMSK